MYNFVPTVYLVMDVMQWPAMKEMGMRGMDIMFVIKPLIYNAIAMVAMIIVSIQVFKRKDLLDNRLHRGNFDTREMGVSIPVNMLETVLDGILETVNLTENNTPKREILARLEYPEELDFPIRKIGRAHV